MRVRVCVCVRLCMRICVLMCSLLFLRVQAYLYLCMFCLHWLTDSETVCVGLSVCCECVRPFPFVCACLRACGPI